MKDRTPYIRESEIEEISKAYRVIQSFIDRLISPNELYLDKFVKGLSDARVQTQNEVTEVKDFTDFIS